MICASCGVKTRFNPCTSCEAEALLAGAYRLEEIIGTGAAATTYRAIRQTDDRTVVIKEMVMSRARADKSRELFEREARVLRQLSHGQIPAYLDDFAIKNGKMQSLCLVQEFIEGTSLADELTSHRYTESEVLEICAELLEILGYLHGLSPPVVHRDLKPRNVMRRSDGKLVLIDFGAVRDALKNVDIGGSSVAGTFGYMAPEQFQGDATPASDLYGLGALAVALLTRREPHTMLDAHGRLQWHEHAAVSAQCRATIDQFIRPEATERPASARAAIEEMRRHPAEGGVSDPRDLPHGPRVAVKERLDTDTDPFHQPPMRPPTGASAPGRPSWVTRIIAIVPVLIALFVSISILFATWSLVISKPAPPIVEVPEIEAPTPSLLREYGITTLSDLEEMSFVYLNIEEAYRPGPSFSHIPKDGVGVVVNRHSIEHPDSAKELPAETYQCGADIAITPEGVPIYARIFGCPMPFHKAIQESLIEWRWEPTGDYVRRDLKIKFKLGQ